MRAPVTALAAIVVGGLLATAAPAPSGAADPTRPTHGAREYTLPDAAGRVDDQRASAVERRTAVLTAANRAGGITPSPLAHHRLVRAEFTVDLDDSEFYGNARLTGPPPDDDRPTIFYSVGQLTGTTCAIGSYISDYFVSIEDYTSEDLPSGWSTGRCVVAELRRVSDGAVVDAFVGRLADVLPRLSVRRPELLDTRRLGLVRGVWTKIDVPITNAGPGLAQRVTVTGRGKGLKVRRGAIGYTLGRGSTGTAEIQVRLVGKQRKTKLKLTAASGTVRAVRAAVVRKVAPPKRPLRGSYRSASGDVSFVVRGNKVVGFRVRTTTTCGPGSIPTSNTYSFRRTVIPRNGIVDAAERGSLYTATLRLKIAGGTVTHGRFGYGGPAGCSASETFTARRAR